MMPVAILFQINMTITIIMLYYTYSWFHQKRDEIYLPSADFAYKTQIKINYNFGNIYDK